MKILHMFKHKDTFHDISGYEDIKWMFTKAVESGWLKAALDMVNVLEEILQSASLNFLS
ncbi:MAG: hypothetical protein WA667_14085 [Candidatus Nitrosopolaris sp.]